MLAEYKFNVDFNDVLTRAKVIAQSLIYYKKIVDKGKDTIPNVMFIGDVNECFCLKAKHFSKHMSHEGVDYNVAASSVGSQMKLVQAIADDVAIIIMAIFYLSSALKGKSVNHFWIIAPNGFIWFIGFIIRCFGIAQYKITICIIDFFLLFARGFILFFQFLGDSK